MVKQKPLIVSVFLACAVTAAATHLKAQDSTSAATAGAQQDTLWRAPNRPPDAAKVEFIEHFYRTIPERTQDEIEKQVIATLDSFAYFAEPPTSTRGKRLIRSSFINITEKIKDYDDHIVMLIFSIRLTPNNESVHIAWRYGVCQAPYRSRDWVYADIPYHVRLQAENITGAVFRKFIEMAAKQTLKATPNKKEQQ